MRNKPAVINNFINKKLNFKYTDYELTSSNVYKLDYEIVNKKGGLSKRAANFRNTRNFILPLSFLY